MSTINTQELNSLLSVMAEQAANIQDQKIKAGTLSTIARIAGMVQKPELMQMAGAQKQAMQGANLQAKTETLGMSLADKQAARESALQMAQFKATSREEFTRLMAELDQQKLQTKQQMEAAELLKRQGEWKNLYERGKQVAWNGPNDPEFQAVVKNLQAGDAAAQSNAGDLLRRAEKAVNAKVANTLKYAEPRAAALGTTIDADKVREHIVARGTAAKYVDDFLDAEAKKVAEAAKIKAHTATAESELRAVGLKGLKLDAAIREAGGQPEIDLVQRLAMTKEGVITGKARTRGITGLAVGLGAAYLASKLFGKGDDDQKIDPQMQMALMQSMLKGKGAGGAGDESQMDSRALMNMSRALNIMKMMGAMQGAQQTAPVDVARLM